MEQIALFDNGSPALVAGPVFVEFELRGKPAHKARHRSRIVFPKDRRQPPFIHNYPDPETEKAEAVLKEAAALFMRGRSPTENPVALLVHVFRPIPESWSKRDHHDAERGVLMPTARPDGDNYLKLVQDALNGVVYKDDSQIVDARVIKRYDAKPAIRIEVREFLAPVVAG